MIDIFLINRVFYPTKAALTRPITRQCGITLDHMERCLVLGREADAYRPQRFDPRQIHANPLESRIGSTLQSLPSEGSNGETVAK
jgi:hypothetical protein